MIVILFFFFFQAEDGIRDLTVTGVQTCALPISTRDCARCVWRCSRPTSTTGWSRTSSRSEERREGKSVDLGGRRIIKKKKKKKKKIKIRIEKKKKNKKEKNYSVTKI